MGASSIEYLSPLFHEATPKDFYDALKIAKQRLLFSAFVTLHEQFDYASCSKLYLLFDKTAGIAVERDGNIISVFSYAHKGLLKYLLSKARKSGGLKLDCFGSKNLIALYSLHGFIPICKTEFLNEFAPFDWNFERDGKPDIIFWVDGLKFKNLNVVYNEDGCPVIPTIDTYEEAKAYRDDFIKNNSCKKKAPTER